MADPRTLFKLEEVRSFLELKSDADKDLLKVLLEGVTAWIEEYCNRTFEVVTYTTETYDGDGGTVLYLDHRPAIAVSTLTITDSAGTVDTIPPSDYVLYANVGKIKLTEGDNYLKGDLNITVTYTAGCATLPPDVKLAGMKLLRWVYRKWSDNRDGISNISAGDVITTYETDVPKEIKNMLDKHRRQVFA